MNYQFYRKTNMKQACRPATFLKRDSNTVVFLSNWWNFKNSCGCFWKHVTLLHNKKLHRHKLAIFNALLYSIAFILNPMMRHEAWAWCGVTLRGMSRQKKHVPKTKTVLLMLYCIDKNWYHFIKEYLEQCSKFAF